MPRLAQASCWLQAAGSRLQWGRPQLIVLVQQLFGQTIGPTCSTQGLEQGVSGPNYAYRTDNNDNRHNQQPTTATTTTTYRAMDSSSCRSSSSRRITWSRRPLSCRMQMKRHRLGRRLAWRPLSAKIYDGQNETDRNNKQTNRETAKAAKQLNGNYARHGQILGSTN